VERNKARENEAVVVDADSIMPIHPILLICPISLIHQAMSLADLHDLSPQPCTSVC
jgi:hypothetical protein